MGSARAVVRRRLLESKLSKAHSRRGLQARITDGIGRQIIGGAYQPGGLLPKEAELAVEFGVSRTSVREGMRVLAAKGLVDIRQKIGTKVRQPENWNLFDTEILRWHEDAGRGAEIGTDLAEVRELLELAAARLASSRATAETLRRIRAAIDKMASPASDREGYAQAVADFHRSVCAASNNVFLQQFGSVVFDAMHGRRRRRGVPRHARPVARSTPLSVASGE